MRLSSACIAAVSLLWIPAAGGQEDSRIIVQADKPKGKVVRELFGTEIKCAHGADGLMTGLRDATNDFRSVVMDEAHSLQPAFMRYKFMRGSWSWEDGIGPLGARPDDPARQKYMGLDEIMAFQTRVIGDASKCHLVVDPSNPEQCAALVAYLNFPVAGRQGNGEEKILGISKKNGRDYKTTAYWADLRARHGHPEPYGIAWFELGNESYLKGAGFDGDPRRYCESTRTAAKAMKAVDPKVRCGLSLDCCPIKNRDWRTRVLEEGGQFADYFICHAYYPFAYPRNWKYRNAATNLDGPKVEELYYKMIMAGAHQASQDWRWFRDQVVKLTPRAGSIRLCFTENGFHLEEDNAKAQNTLLVGVYDADLIGMMVEHAQELALDNANLFFLQGDDPWAFIQHSFARRDNSAVLLRPPYWSLYLWTHYFGTTLVTTDVRCDTFDIPLPKGGDWPKEGIFWSRISAQDKIPVMSAHSSLSSDGKILYLMVVNRDLYSDRETTVELRGFHPQDRADVHILNSSVTTASRRTEDSIPVWESGNEETPGTVKIRDSQWNIPGTTVQIRFPAHSATAVVLRSK
jgi:alpha-L-arabinofuranosidase